MEEIGKKKTIFLDLDGVCVDFAKSVLAKFNKKHLMDTWPKGDYGIANVMGMTSEEMWEFLEKDGSDFWRNLEEYPWFWDMYKKLSTYSDVIFLTSPNLDPNSLKGKIEWIQDRFGKNFRKYIITSEKYFCATDKNHLLIDDMEKNCKLFSKYGAQSILFPQVWNSNHHIPNGYQYVMDSVESWAKEN